MVVTILILRIKKTLKNHMSGIDNFDNNAGENYKF